MEIDRRILVVDAFRALIIRYGFKRVTMSDIASAVNISRPALYLLFPDKEEIFKAVVRRENERLLSEIRAGLPACSRLKEKLQFALEVRWVSTFEMIRALPDANEIHSVVNEFAKGTFQEVLADFHALLVEILKPWEENVSKAGFTLNRIARNITLLPEAFMEAATDADDLRELFEDQLNLLMAAIGLRDDIPRSTNRKCSIFKGKKAALRR